MEVTSMSSLRSMVRLSQPKPAWANPAVFSAGVGSLKMKRNRLVVVAKMPSKKGRHDWQDRNVLRSSSSRKFDPNGKPKFVIFVRRADVKNGWFKKTEWLPLAMVEGSSTAKLILAKTTNNDTITRELASVIYKDENKIEKEAKLKLNNATEFRYGFKHVENGDIEAAKSIKDITELPRKEEVENDFSGDTSKAKEPFGELTSLGSIKSESES